MLTDWIYFSFEYGLIARLFQEKHQSLLGDMPSYYPLVALTLGKQNTRVDLSQYAIDFPIGQR
jgi:hypothetical protein